MKNYVISTDHASERRQHISQEFAAQGIAFEFFTAIIPAQIAELSERFDINLSNNQRLSPEEKACFFSHLSLWQKMLDENIEYMAIFEDDVHLGEKAHLFLNNDDWLDLLDFHLIKLETWQELVHIGKPLLSMHKRDFSRLKSCHVGMAAYIIHKSAIAPILHFIRNLPDHERFAIDHVIFDALLNTLNTWQMHPALAIQADRLLDTNQATKLPSQINQGRKNNSFIYIANDSNAKKLKKFFRRIYRSIGKRTFYQRIPFR
ncbi:glycosyl transferase, family 25 [Moraxella cuniculi DSM 21768]|uniref:Glycosyl transferase, family 25 n=1 Tax=Moraxella cuniculi DSM 21768 TaxID=1122245 RepID=A0A1N7FMC5_9GAMM|nr:glycosyltransferase family 25 protein [Moraxella cuniculi]OOS05707.1 hypothetical protein B0189_06160 [Moraxella cuniculi]SIS01443.1 glycosyl transferase, family 25 [Moraxella cuniculi DSM 21768]